MNQEDLREEYKHRLPPLFKQILLMYKDAPSNKSWVLEKLMDLFCKDIAHDIELLQAVDFSAFLNGFLEDGSVIYYPDFVMNNVSLMAAEALSSRNDCSFLEESAFIIIRSPLQYWMVTKGHRVDVTFQIYKKWVQQRSMLHRLDGVQFDVAQALLHSLASPYNYTRQSAGDYVVDLIKLTYNDGCQEDSVNESLCKIKSRLRSTICKLFGQFNATLGKSADAMCHLSPEVETCRPQHLKYFGNYRQAAANYCRLLSECALSSDDWCRANSATEMFDQLVELLQIVAADDDVDKTGLFRSCTAMLVRLINHSSTAQFLKIKKLVKLLVRVSEIRQCSISSDAVYAAGRVLTQLKMEAEDHNLLVELSLLPLLLTFDVTPQSVLNTCPAAVQIVKSAMKISQKTHPSSLLKEAIDNLSILSDAKVNSPSLGPFIDYLELRRMDPPAKVGLPILNGTIIRSESCLHFLVLKLASITLAISKLTDENCLLNDAQASSIPGNVQVYVKACLGHSGISSAQILLVMNCYQAVLKNLLNCGSCKSTAHLPPTTRQQTGSVYSQQVLQEVLQLLQFKMFDLDANVREVAVSAVGNLFLVVHPDSSSFDSSADMTASLSSLWQCVDNKAEGVATKVLEVLLQASLSGRLDFLLTLMNITKADVITKIDHFLLSSPWDNIKPVAFNLLTRVCSREVLVRYADVCLHQDNVCLSLVGLDYIQDIFFSQQEDKLPLEEKVDSVISLLVQGWGDLILQKVNAADVCSFRKASLIVAKILAFLERPDICAVIDKRISDFSIGVRMTQNDHYEQSHSAFLKECDKILRTLGHIDLPQQKPNKCRDMPENDNLASISAKPGDKLQLAKKRKGSYIAKDNEEVPSNKKQKCTTLTNENISYCCLVCSMFNSQTISTSRNGKHEENSHDDTPHDDGDELHSDLAIKSMASDDLYLDSTKELPALTLRTEPFASQKVIHEITSQKRIHELTSHTEKYLDSTTLKSSTELLVWLMFREMFKRIDPDSQQDEAQRSTDEYERNSLILLCDLEQVVARGFPLLKDNLEQEMISHFFSTFSSLINLSLNTENARLQREVMNEFIIYLRIMLLVLSEEESVVKFILQKRRSVLKPPFEDGESEFTLRLFLERRDHVNSHGSKVYIKEKFPAPDRLKNLLQLYMIENMDSVHSLNSSLDTLQKVADTDSKIVHSSNSSLYTLQNVAETESKIVHSSNSSLDTLQKVADTDSKIVHSSNSPVDNLQTGDANDLEFFRSIIKDAAFLKAPDRHFLSTVFVGEMEDLKTIQERVKVLISSSRRNTFQPVLKIIQGLTKLMVIVVCGQDDGSPVERLADIVACFGQLENWCLAEGDEFDSDGDDDPTAIDCF